MRYSCTTCDASLTLSSARSEKMTCPACGGELQAEADVYHLRTDHDPTRRYDLEELKARLQAEKEAVAALDRAPSSRSPEQIWFVGLHGKQVGPLTLSGLEGLRTRGQLAAATLVWREGFPTWVAAEAVPELRRLVGLREALPALPFPEERSRAPPAPPADDGAAPALAAVPEARHQLPHQLPIGAEEIDAEVAEEPTAPGVEVSAIAPAPPAPEPVAQPVAEPVAAPPSPMMEPPPPAAPSEPAVAAAAERTTDPSVPRAAPRRGRRGAQPAAKGRGSRPVGNTVPPPLPHLKAPAPANPQREEERPPQPAAPSTLARFPAPSFGAPVSAAADAPPGVNISRKIAAGLAVVAALVAALLLLRSEPAAPQGKPAAATGGR